MYEILIVDDSVLDIECISFLIEKFDLPLRSTKAVNGHEALSLLEQKNAHFDILFTDIKMPFMDGLELAREVRRISPDTKIIIFSGYNDFEYAKTAITIGVENYLMKPVVPADFENTMQKVIRSIEVKQQQDAARQLQTHLVKKHVLWQALHNTIPPEHLTAFLEPYYSMLLIECTNEFFSTVNDDFQKKLEELLIFPFDYLNLYPSRSLLFIKKPLKDTYLLAAAQSICFLAAEDYAQNFYIAFNELPDNSHISRVYSSLEKRIESRFFFPDCNILLPSDTGHTYSSSGHISMDVLKEDLRLQDYNTLNSHLEEIFAALKSDKTQSLIYVKYCFTEMVKVLNQAAGKNQYDLNHLAEKIYSSSNILELIDMVRALSASVQENSESKETQTLKTDKIRQYIYQNYEKPLTLDEIAAHFYISPNYLCSIFKKENGCSLIKFINDYRLKRAASLLSATQMRIKNIADAVGFRNSSYFIQKFHDYYGETPDSYRQNHSSNFTPPHVKGEKYVKIIFSLSYPFSQHENPEQNIFYFPFDCGASIPLLYHPVQVYDKSAYS